jgi:hypothetical protein
MQAGSKGEAGGKRTDPVMLAGCPGLLGYRMGALARQNGEEMMHFFVHFPGGGDCVGDFLPQQ